MNLSRLSPRPASRLLLVLVALLSVAAVLVTALTGSSRGASSGLPAQTSLTSANTAASTSNTDFLEPGAQRVARKAAGPTIYVAPGGSNSASGTSQHPLATISVALSQAVPGTVIHLASGSYAVLEDKAARTGWVTITGAGDPTAPVIDGGHLYGSQYLRIEDVAFDAGIVVRDSEIHGLNQLSNHDEILNSVIDCGNTAYAPTTIAIDVRSAARNLLIQGDDINHCSIGYWSLSHDTTSTGISILHTTIDDMYGDAIDLGAQQNVTISYDHIENIDDPSNVQHDDGIQFYGNDSNVTITHNVIDNSRVQLIFIDGTDASAITGVSTVSNVLIANNLLYGAGGWAIQDAGGVNVTLVNNTIWDNQLGGLLLRLNPVSGIQPIATTIVGNIIQSYALLNMTATPQTENYNLIGQVQNGVSDGAHDLVGANPGFVAPQTGDFALASDSDALDYAPTSTLAGASDDAACWNVETSLCSLGAMQAGTPEVAYGSRTSFAAPN